MTHTHRHTYDLHVAETATTWCIRSAAPVHGIYRVGQKSDTLLLFQFPLLLDALYLQIVSLLAYHFPQ